MSLACANVIPSFIIQNSWRYLSEPLSALSKRFNLTTKKDYFPYKEVTKENSHYVGPYFGIESYASENDTQAIIDEKKQFLQSKQKCLFDFKQAMYYYNLLDIEVSKFCLH